MGTHGCELCSTRLVAGHRPSAPQVPIPRLPHSNSSPQPKSRPAERRRGILGSPATRRPAGSGALLLAGCVYRGRGHRTCCETPQQGCQKSPASGSLEIPMMAGKTGKAARMPHQFNSGSLDHVFTWKGRWEARTRVGLERVSGRKIREALTTQDLPHGHLSRNSP